MKFKLGQWSQECADKVYNGLMKAKMEMAESNSHFRNSKFEIKKSVWTCDIAQSIPIYM